MVLTLSILLCILLLKHTSAFLLLSQQYHHHQNHHTLETLFKFRLFSSSTFQKDEDNYDAEARGEWIRFAPKGRSFGHDADNRYLKFGRIWYERLQQIREFKEEYGHTNVPEIYPKNLQLGHWVFNQRKEYSKQMKSISNNNSYNKEVDQQNQQNIMIESSSSSSITDDRIEALNELGFVWSLRKKPTEVVGWDERYEELIAYKEHHGDCNVPQTYKKNMGLARWVNKKRNQYKQKSKSLTPQQIDALNAIGFTWSMFEKIWEERYLQLKQFQYEHDIGHNIDDNLELITKENSQLGSWVKKQKQEMKKFRENKKSTLTDARIKKLNDLGFFH